MPFARPVSPGWLGSPSKINGCPCTLQTLFICVTPFQPTTAVSYALSSIPYDSLPFLSVPQSTQSTATATGHRYSTTTPRLHGQTEALRRSVRHGAGPARLAGAVVPSLGPPAGLVDSGGQVGDRDPLRPVAKDFVRGNAAKVGIGSVGQKLVRSDAVDVLQIHLLRACACVCVRDFA